MPIAARRRPLIAGLALAALYLAAAVFTLAVSDRPFRPLFDGLAPPLPYRWVNPPKAVARDNQQPAAATQEAPLGSGGSPFVNATPDDGQVTLLLQDTAVAPHPPDSSVAVTVTPLDVLTLGPLPKKMSAESNAYRVEVTYRPSGVPVTDFRGDESSIALVGADATDALLFSQSGQSWDKRTKTSPIAAGHGLETPFAGPGYYVVTKIDDAAGGGGTSPLVVGLVLLLPAAAVGGLVLRSRARARAEAARRAATKRRAPPPRGGRKSKRRRR